MDKISSRILKDSLPCTLTTITRIVNNSFFTNTFARAWKTAEVTPILKCGNLDVPNNYRPFSLLPIVSKITDRLVHGQLMEYLIRNNKLAVHQSGNRKLHSTETAPVGGLGKFFFRVIRLENASSLFSLYPSRHSIYQKQLCCMSRVSYSRLCITKKFQSWSY